MSRRMVLKHCILYLILLIAVSVSFDSRAQSVGESHSFRELVVTGRRPMKEIGVKSTVFDSLALKENIALSMADVLTYNSSAFVKNYGRATLSTVAFRGTSPSHTQVTWNGMRIDNPMLGMTDFSTIPSFFIDDASLLHGSSSVNETGGGLGGLVRLATSPGHVDGFDVAYVQGIGSFSTFDEFLRLGYGNRNWQFSTRAVCSSSENDYKYVNHDKKVNIYDDDKNIIGQYNPVERNRSGAYRDIHLLQEIYYDNNAGDRLGMSAWYIDSERELPVLTTDYGDDRDFLNRRRERTLRAVMSWSHSRDIWKTVVRGGYINTHMAYDYRREVSAGLWADMTRSRSRISTLFGRIESDYSPTDKFFFNLNFSARQHFVRSEDKNVILQNGDKAIVGYDKARMELSGAASAKWQPVRSVGLSFVLREELMGDRWSSVVPALFFDALLSEKGNVLLKASLSRNRKFPTLNDLYFLPGGNPDLKSEKGWSYDVGASFRIAGGERRLMSVAGELTWFDSRIEDWIIWLPTPKGFFSPRNMMSVHAYGIESGLKTTVRPSTDWIIGVNASYSWTPSVNTGEKMSPADKSVGKQLPYIPKHSASLTGRLSWKDWGFLYKWAFYSERYTMSSNESTLSGHLPEYYMSNITIERSIKFRPFSLQLKLAVNNIFDEDYLSVLSRPMPGRNFELFVGFTL